MELTLAARRQVTRAQVSSTATAPRRRSPRSKTNSTLEYESATSGRPRSTGWLRYSRLTSRPLLRRSLTIQAAQWGQIRLTGSTPPWPAATSREGLTARRHCPATTCAPCGARLIPAAWKMLRVCGSSTCFRERAGCMPSPRWHSLPAAACCYSLLGQALSRPGEAHTSRPLSWSTTTVR